MDEVSIAHELLNLNYKLFDGKHVPKIMLPDVFLIGESDLAVDEDMLHVELMFGLMLLILHT